MKRGNQTACFTREHVENAHWLSHVSKSSTDQQEFGEQFKPYRKERIQLSGHATLLKRSAELRGGSLLKQSGLNVLLRHHFTTALPIPFSIGTKRAAMLFTRRSLLLPTKKVFWSTHVLIGFKLVFCCNIASSSSKLVFFFSYFKEAVFDFIIIFCSDCFCSKVSSYTLYSFHHTILDPCLSVRCMYDSVRSGFTRREVELFSLLNFHLLDSYS